jgi:hypothetical protein
VRDFGITSRKFILDAMAGTIEQQTVMAISVYPKESNPLWGETSTRTAHTLKVIQLILLIILIKSGISISRRSRNGISDDMLELRSS